GRRQKLRELKPAVAVRRAHHGDLYVLVAQAGDAPGPLAFDRASPFELEAELDEKRDRGVEGFHDDADVVHPLHRHAPTLVPLLRRPISRSGSQRIVQPPSITSVSPVISAAAGEHRKTAAPATSSGSPIRCNAAILSSTSVRKR